MVLLRQTAVWPFLTDGILPPVPGLTGTFNVQTSRSRPNVWTSLKALVAWSLPPKIAIVLSPVNLHMVWYISEGPLAIDVHEKVLVS